MKLDRLQFRAIRVITGNMRCTPVYTLEVESGVLPLAYRRKQLALQYFGKTCRIKDHLIGRLYQDYYHYAFFDVRPYAPPVVGRCKRLVASLGLPFAKLESFSLRELHSSNDALVKYSLLKTKSNYPAIQFRNDYFELVESRYRDSVLNFTDGSKFVDRCGSAFVAYLAEGPHVVGKRLPKMCGIFFSRALCCLTCC